MKGINKVIIVGNLGQDPEVRYTTSGAAVTNISVATSEQWKDKNTYKAPPLMVPAFFGQPLCARRRAAAAPPGHNPS